MAIAVFPPMATWLGYYGGWGAIACHGLTLQLRGNFRFVAEGWVSMPEVPIPAWMWYARLLKGAHGLHEDILNVVQLNAMPLCLAVHRFGSIESR
jgi:hypothetical protein